MILKPHQLRAARVARGMSQHELSVKSGVGVALISRIEGGQGAHCTTMEKLTEALGISVGVPEVAL